MRRTGCFECISWLRSSIKCEWVCFNKLSRVSTVVLGILIFEWILPRISLTSKWEIAVSSLPWLRAMIDTCAPLSTRMVASESPSPVLPPVTYACFSSGLRRILRQEINKNNLPSHPDSTSSKRTQPWVISVLNPEAHFEIAELSMWHYHSKSEFDSNDIWLTTLCMLRFIKVYKFKNQLQLHVIFRVELSLKI